MRSNDFTALRVCATRAVNETGVGNDGDEIQRSTAGRKAAMVMDVMKGNATPANLALT